MKQLLSFMLMMVGINTFAQVKIGSPGVPNGNAVLELDGGTNKGFLLPRITTTDMNGAGFSSAPNGLLIYNSTDGFLYIRKAATWQKVTDATNNGGFTLPYSGSAATGAGLNVFKIQNSNAGNAISGEALGGGYGVYGYSSSDAGGYFTSVSGPALITGNGNAGIGTTPTLGKLVVRGTVGAVSAMFGDNTSGVSIMNNLPSLGFNFYFSGGGKSIVTGFGAQLGLDQNNGRFVITSAPASVSGSGTAMPQTERLVILANGNVGIDAATPTATLQVGRGNTIGGTAQFDGTSFSSHFNYDTEESTYIRGGKATSQVVINDQSSGNVRLAEGGGKVGIGLSNPPVALSFATVLGKKISLYRGATGDAGFGVFANELRINSDNANADITFGWDNLTFGYQEKMRIRGNSGNVGIGTNDPGYKLDVNGRMRLRHNGVTSGLWFNNSANVETSFVGQYTDTKFGIFGSSGWQFAIDNIDGTVYCGSPNLDTENLTKAPGYKLKVFGKVIAEEVRVQVKSAWPDYVFSKDYKLNSLNTVEAYIAANNHLPNVPAAAEVEKSGIALGEMQTKMMEKIEELTLYIIGLQKQIDALKKKN
ncbi:MAG: hypothetical protein V4722_27195 [Bacteroidota bacterium]